MSCDAPRIRPRFTAAPAVPGAAARPRWPRHALERCAARERSRLSGARDLAREHPRLAYLTPTDDPSPDAAGAPGRRPASGFAVAR